MHTVVLSHRQRLTVDFEYVLLTVIKSLKNSGLRFPTMTLDLLNIELGCDICIIKKLIDYES